MKARFEVFTVLVSKINRCIHKIKTEEMSEFELKSSHVSCLYYLYKNRSLTAKELCDLCGEDKANVSRAIKHLEGLGFIYCPSTAQKRYQSSLILTQKGEETGEKIAKKVDKVLEEASKGLTEDNRQVFYQSLALICDNLEKVCSRYGE